jgi:hypothetical protein
MNSKQSRTLRAIFTEPTPANIAWADIERLLVTVGCVMTEGSGSRVHFEHGVEAESFHRPHPARKPNAIRSGSRANSWQGSE